MRAIIHSIHSQVPRTIRELDHTLNAIISLDSHLDVSLGGDDRIYPRELRMIARRTGAHTEFRRILGARPASKGSLLVAIPERMLSKHAMDMESNLPRLLRVHDPGESLTSVVNFMENERGIEVFQSPPKSLLKLVSFVGRAEPWILDIDVDYMHEMQRECYTRIINPEPDVLQSMARVVEFVRRSKPEVITLSEAKLSAIRNRESKFSTFVGRLQTLGYEIEEGDVVSSDADVLRGISVCKEFYRSVSKSLMLVHMDEMVKGEFESFRREEEVAARAFFTSKGYAF
jgi:hypothetical protein